MPNENINLYRDNISFFGIAVVEKVKHERSNKHYRGVYTRKITAVSYYSILVVDHIHNGTDQNIFAIY